MNPNADLTFAFPAKDREWVWLSESLTATLRVDGPAPLLVTAPKDWLAPAAAGAWKVTPLGNPRETRAADGRAQWTQTLRLDPYIAGEAVPIAFAPVSARAGGAESRSLELPSKTVTVKTRLAAARATDALPITGFEDPPAPPPTGSNWPPLALVGVGVLAVAVVATRWKRKPAPPVAPTAAERLAELAARSDALDDAAFASELSRLLRDRLESVHGVPATRRATPELGTAPPLDRYAPLLDRCDAARFGAAPLERGELLDVARGLLAEPEPPRRA